MRGDLHIGWGLVESRLLVATQDGGTKSPSLDGSNAITVVFRKGIFIDFSL